MTGDQIRKARKRLGLTQEQLAERMGLHGKQTIIPSGAKADSGGDSQRAESLNLWRQVLGGRGHGYSDRIAGGF